MCLGFGSQVPMVAQCIRGSGVIENMFVHRIRGSCTLGLMLVTLYSGSDALVYEIPLGVQDQCLVKYYTCLDIRD